MRNTLGTGIEVGTHGVARRSICSILISDSKVKTFKLLKKYIHLQHTRLIHGIIILGYPEMPTIDQN
jgi:hypothetical protein